MICIISETNEPNIDEVWTTMIHTPSPSPPPTHTTTHIYNTRTHSQEFVFWIQFYTLLLLRCFPFRFSVYHNTKDTLLMYLFDVFLFKRMGLSWRRVSWCFWRVAAIVTMHAICFPGCIVIELVSNQSAASFRLRWTDLSVDYLSFPLVWTVKSSANKSLLTLWFDIVM